MYYYSKNSRSKVIHSADCFHIQSVEVDHIGSFETLEEAYASGYRLCRNCSPLAKQYHAESDALVSYCQQYAVSFFLHDRFIGVTAPNSRWRIVPNANASGFLLYHRNTFKTAHDAESAIPGYHLQRIRKKNIYGYLEYIVDHEYYRMMNPVYVRPPKKEPPTKGTKRYKKQQEKAARSARRKAISNILNLIDNLRTKPQGTSALL